jgi:predicted ATPase/DNA-binding CsgD family transcriptional regulator
MDDTSPQTWIEPLQPREIEILGLISDGLSNREISQRLHISTDTVKWYNRQMYKKLGVSNRSQAMKVARQQGLFEEKTSSPTAEESPTHNNLPAQLTSFIGRGKEVEEIIGLLKTHRLVALTGSGGTGKTRLALQVAGNLTQSYRDGVWLVELAAIREAELVPNAIAEVLMVKPMVDTPLVEILQRFLRHKHLLLLLDNFEHLPEATPVAGELLAAAPQLSILATSRERLHVYGEQEYVVQPLRLPDMRQPRGGEQILTYEAIQLFLERARAVRPKLEVNEKNLQAIAQICQRLDGLPLALELAASQMKIYPAPLLAQQLADNLGTLPDGPRDLPARQRTLRATIQWSENLLKPEEKLLFARIAVFTNGATLEAIEQICGPGLSKKTIELLSALVEKNLVFTREGQDGELRFHMLETIHEHAKEHLGKSDEAKTIYRRHAAYYTELASEAQLEFRTARHVYWFPKIQIEQDNFRTALSWSLEGGDLQYALRLVGALRDHWYYNGFVVEGRHWITQVLNLAENAPPDLLGGAFCTAGNLAYSAGDILTGEEMLRRAIDQYQQAGDENGKAWAFTFLSIMGIRTPDKIDAYIEFARQSLETFRKLGDQPGIAQALNILGELNRSQGNYETARRYYEKCLKVVQVTGERMREGMQYENLGVIAYHQKQYEHALELIRHGLTIFWEVGINYGMATCLAMLAGPTARLGHYKRAARLLGAANAVMESLGVSHQPVDLVEINQFTDLTRQALGEDTFQAELQAGQSLSIEEAMDYALNAE